VYEIVSVRSDSIKCMYSIRTNILQFQLEGVGRKPDTVKCNGGATHYQPVIFRFLNLYTIIEPAGRTIYSVSLGPFRFLGLKVPIPPGTWLSVSCECCVLSRWRSLRRVDHSSRGVVTSVCVWVCYRVKSPVINNTRHPQQVGRRGHNKNKRYNFNVQHPRWRMLQFSKKKISHSQLY
jgi:hypothetical protein